MSNNAKTKLGLWQSTFFSIIGLVFIVLLSYIIEKTINPDFNRTLLTLISIVIAIIPPLLWLSIFYRQDRLNPEPKSFVFKTLLLGLLIQKAIYSPIVGMIFPKGISSLSTRAASYIFTILIIAFLQEGIKLLAVRYSIYPSKEFDEKIDGIIYGSAMGLGFATMTSIDNIISTGGAMLSNVTSLVVIETFAHASITGLSCYILGVAKQKKFNILRLPFALVLASLLNAVTNFLLDVVTRRGFKVSYIVGLIPAALVALVVFTVLVIISNRNEKEGLAEKVSVEENKPFLSVLPVWVLFTIAIFAGVLMGTLGNRNIKCNVDNFIELQYPSSWVQFKGDQDLFKAYNIIKGEGQEFISVKKLPLQGLLSIDAQTEEDLLQNAAASWAIKAGLNHRFYQAEKGYYLSSKGKESYVIDYIYVGNTSNTLGDMSKPSISYGRDVLSIKGDHLYVITLSSSYEDYVKGKSIQDQMNYSFIN